MDKYNPDYCFGNDFDQWDRNEKVYAFSIYLCDPLFSRLLHSLNNPAGRWVLSLPILLKHM